MTIQEEYAKRCARPEAFADIYEHLPTLARYASMVRTVTEFGVRTGNSATGFLHGLSRNGGRYIGYDVDEVVTFKPPQIDGVEISFHKQDTSADDFSIAPTDILFIDSCHREDHIVKELRHAHSVKKFLIFHDTSSEWVKLGGTGPRNALFGFIMANCKEWHIREHYENCNGLTVLERK